MTGRQMAREMAEQPARLRELVGRAAEIRERVRALRPTPLSGVSIVARLRHGPIAAVTRGFPVVALSAPGPAHALTLALALGHDPDAPEGLSKVTAT